MTNCNYVWTYQAGASAAADARGRGPGASPKTSQEHHHYKVINSFFGNNRKLAGSGTGARLEYQDIESSFLELVGTKVLEQPVTMEHEQTSRYYLQPIAGSEAAKVGAGLFMKTV